ncbi:LSC2-succinate-CoA ligase beta subunit [Fusarium fujikuroi]|nr:LSC2-succinate-CoA ligase beta subunit [Fusarium fujikuroi]
MLKDATLDIHVEADFGKAAQEAVRLADIGVKAERLQLKHRSIRELSEEVEEDSKAG